MRAIPQFCQQKFPAVVGRTNGDARAQAALGIAYTSGNYPFEERWPENVRWLERAVEQELDLLAVLLLPCSYPS